MILLTEEHKQENKIQELYNQLSYREQAMYLKTLANQRQIEFMYERALKATKNPRADLVHMINGASKGITAYRNYLNDCLDDIPEGLVEDIYESSERFISEYETKLKRLEENLKRTNWDRLIIEKHGKQALWDYYLFKGR